MYSIGDTAGFIRTSRLRWVGNVVKTDGDHIPKVLMYRQLAHGQRNVGKSGSSLKDELKTGLTVVNVPHRSFEAIDNERA